MKLFNKTVQIDPDLKRRFRQIEINSFKILHKTVLENTLLLKKQIGTFIILI